jgi:isocitrate/isopropylmalate dehydrogenase
LARDAKWLKHRDIEMDVIDTGSQTKTCVVIPGDGIGREVVPRVVRIMARLCPDFDHRLYHAGVEEWRSSGEAISNKLIQEAVGSSGVLFGCTGTPAPPPASYRSPILTLRRALGTYANARFCQSRSNSGVNVVIVRECSEGLYVQREKTIEGGVSAESVVTVRGTKRVARAAASFAKQRGRRVTVVHKANVLSVTDGLFRRVAIETLEEEGIAWDEALTDAAAYHLVSDPKRYDVLLTNSYAGDILSNVAAAMAGGLGLVPSIAIGDGPPLAEPIHGSAPDLVGRGLADPVGAILSAALLFDAWGKTDAARNLRVAVLDHLERRVSARVQTNQVFDEIEARLGFVNE